MSTWVYVEKENKLTRSSKKVFENNLCGHLCNQKIFKNVVYSKTFYLQHNNQYFVIKFNQEWLHELHRSSMLNKGHMLVVVFVLWS